MIRKITTIGLSLVVAMVSFNCSDNDDNNEMENPIAATYVLEDQMGRPAINTVFVSANSKDNFNTTIPSEQESAYSAMFKTNLEALSPAFDASNTTDANALGQNAATFSSFLATDVLNVTLDGKTTFYDGTNVLTGRALADDAITVELLLIFGGEDFTENPALSDDNVSANDKDFLTSFPYLASPW